jgi:hypothetical protein
MLDMLILGFCCIYEDCGQKSGDYRGLPCSTGYTSLKLQRIMEVMLAKGKKPLHYHPRAFSVSPPADITDTDIVTRHKVLKWFCSGWAEGNWGLSKSGRLTNPMRRTRKRKLIQINLIYLPRGDNCSRIRHLIQCVK